MSHREKEKASRKKTARAVGRANWAVAGPSCVHARAAPAPGWQAAGRCASVGRYWVAAPAGPPGQKMVQIEPEAEEGKKRTGSSPTSRSCAYTHTATTAGGWGAQGRRRRPGRARHAPPRPGAASSGRGEPRVRPSPSLASTATAAMADADGVVDCSHHSTERGHREVEEIKGILPN